MSGGATLQARPRDGTARTRGPLCLLGHAWEMGKQMHIQQGWCGAAAAAASLDLSARPCGGPAAATHSMGVTLLSFLMHRQSTYALGRVWPLTHPHV